jgi:hypothetical protein
MPLPHAGGTAQAGRARDNTTLQAFMDHRSDSRVPTIAGKRIRTTGRSKTGRAHCCLTRAIDGRPDRDRLHSTLSRTRRSLQVRPACGPGDKTGRWAVRQRMQLDVGPGDQARGGCPQCTNVDIYSGQAFS